MRRLRWVLLVLYVTLILGLIIGPIALQIVDPGLRWLWFGLALFHVACQFIFILAPGQQSMLVPVRPRRLVVPVAIGGLMMALLIGGLVISLAEVVIGAGAAELWPTLFLLVVGLMWVVWGLLFFRYCKGLDRFSVVSRMVYWILGGSLLQLLATVPSHFIVTRRPGCFVGFFTAVGLFSGLFVATWVFGPGIVLLFWLESRKRMAGHCPQCGYNLRGLSQLRCPECGRPFTLKEVRMTADQLELTGPAS